MTRQYPAEQANGDFQIGKQIKSDIFIRSIERLNLSRWGNPAFRIIAGLADEDGVVTDTEFRTWPDANCAYEVCPGHERWQPGCRQPITWEATPKGNLIICFHHNL
jgi:hypothetical protein